MDQQSARLEPLAAKWASLRAALGDRYDAKVCEIVRLSFYAGATCTIDHLFSRPDHGIALVMLSSEVRDFITKMTAERATLQEAA